ncbi:MAG: endonuclease/exonuclease/phosphatase family protein [Candidatus Liptonbacteria bacterium]|nr:endonuclease/exonuclease/phosphatase family protein [Candidatus Liptonbacteria bacterium]
MKLICLNIWGGKLFEPLVEFIKRSAETADIFCFQEVFQTPGEPLYGELASPEFIEGTEPKPLPSGGHADMFAVFEKILPDFRGYFAKNEEGWDFHQPVSFPIALGQASFVRNALTVRAHRQISVYETASGKVEEKWERPRGMQYLEIDDGKDMPLRIFNLHGLLDSGHKRDTEKRLAHFELARKYVDEAVSRTILCGDFNAYPDTRSVGMFEEKMRNLLKEYGMPRTRNSNYADMEKYSDYWGDHIFATPDIKVNNFAVLEDIVSDHMALMVEFS